MGKIDDFVAEHLNDDVSRLVLDREKWPGVDIGLAVNCIESRRKLRGKVQEWYDEPRLLFPMKLSAEQCSSSATGRYKAALAERIVMESGCGSGWRIADLTGGLGVDSWFFSHKASQVLYCEMKSQLCDAAVHNFSILGASNITVRNCVVVHQGLSGAVSPWPGKENPGMEASVAEILSPFCPDIVYLDPARRGDGGRKVFLIEDCTPDVLSLKDEIFRQSRHILLKLSPMADITMVCCRLGNSCREVHVVASGGECKELLIWMDREWCGECIVKSVEIQRDSSVSVFGFCPSEEETAGKKMSYSRTPIVGDYLFEPGKALMKAGAFNLISERFGVAKLGHSTHYYIMSGPDEFSEPEILPDELCRMGKVFRIIWCGPLDRRSIRTVGQEWPDADVTARNIPMDTDTFRRKLGQSKAKSKSEVQDCPAEKNGGIHVFGLKSDAAGNLIIVTERL